MHLNHRTRVAAQRREEMHLHLLVSGLLLASIKPIHEIEIEDVIKHAQVSRGSFYNYFQSLQALYDELARKLMQELFSEIEILAPRHSDTVERLASTIRLLIRLLVKYPVLGSFITKIQWPQKNQNWELFQAITRDISLGIDEGKFTNMPVSIGANIAIGSIIGGVHTMLLERFAEGFEDKIANQVLIGLGVTTQAACAYSQLQLPEYNGFPDTGILGKLADKSAHEAEFGGFQWKK